MAQFPIDFPSFNRRYVLLPMLVLIVLVSSGYFITESRRDLVKAAAREMLASQQREQLLLELPYELVNAETAQRGYLLTEDPSYLQPYEKSKRQVGVLLRSLQESYANVAGEQSRVELIVDYSIRKMAEVDSTVAAFMAGNKDSVLEYIKTNVGAQLMNAVRTETSTMREHESRLRSRKIEEWNYQHRISSYLSAATTALNIVLLVVAGIFITRDIERRTVRGAELDREVAQRTEELTRLTLYTQRATEREKARLARELHDELGSLLVAIKMDLAQIGKHIDHQGIDVSVRWQRIHAALNAGVDLKRRVIEELRPTLLDNMGIVAALQWQAEQTASQAGIRLNVEMPADEPALQTDSAIAVFRVAQEALTNVAKHSHATTVTCRLVDHGSSLSLTIEDDGRGMSADALSKTGSHGLVSMRHRIQSLGGQFSIETVEPHGTRIQLNIPKDGNLESTGSPASVAAPEE